MIHMRTCGRCNWRRPVPFFLHEFDHLRQRSPREKNPAHAFFLHKPGIVMGDGSSPAAEETNVVRAIFLEQIDHLLKKFDMPAVVARDADGANILLHRGAGDVASRAVIAKINDFDSMADEFEIDGADGAVVPITNGDGSQQANRSRCGSFAHTKSRKLREGLSPLPRL